VRKQTTLDAAIWESRTAPVPAPETPASLLNRARDYAETVDLDVDTDALAWDISNRAKRRAGCCRYQQATGQITIILTWPAYQEFGWAEYTGVIRHELVHAWEFEHFGESSHGKRFKRKAREVDAPLHCRSFTDARLELVCLDEACNWQIDRHRASKPVKEPNEPYRCGECGGEYEVRHVASGQTWQTSAGYERVRSGLAEEW
jgi:predicted SprT family Zn-dependent metalloprotease